MTGTVLRASGTIKAVREFLASTHWEPCATYFRGQLPRPSATRKSSVSGFNLLVCEAESLPAQVRSTLRFLEREKEELRRLNDLGLRAVADMGVVSRPETVASFFRFPVALLESLAASNLDLEVSYYGVQER